MKLPYFLGWKMINKRYELLEHIADAYVAAYGRNLTEAFENAAVAMFDVMTDVSQVSLRVEDHVEAKGEDEYALLYGWLEALLMKADVNGMLYSRFKITELNQIEGEFKLKADIWGEKFDAKRHLQKVGVKAITYHNMEIIHQPHQATLKFILDI